ncbi:MAG: hypothetical protein ACYC65_13850 [Candidatus Limnocylindrales bacterium]
MRVRTVATTVMVLGVFASHDSAFGTGYADPQSACDRAIARAMAIDPASDMFGAGPGLPRLR